MFKQVQFFDYVVGDREVAATVPKQALLRIWLMDQARLPQAEEVTEPDWSVYPEPQLLGFTLDGFVARFKAIPPSFNVWLFEHPTHTGGPASISEASHPIAFDVIALPNNIVPPQQEEYGDDDQVVSVVPIEQNALVLQGDGLWHRWGEPVAEYPEPAVAQPQPTAEQPEPVAAQ